MRLLNTYRRFDSVIRSHNPHILACYNDILNSPKKINTRPMLDFVPVRDGSSELEDIRGALHIASKNRDYTLYVLGNDLHYNPDKFFIKNWVDFRTENIKALCVIEGIKSSQMSHCIYKRSRRATIPELNFLFDLCESLSLKD